MKKSGVNKLRNRLIDEPAAFYIGHAKQQLGYIILVIQLSLIDSLQVEAN